MKSALILYKSNGRRLELERLREQADAMAEEQKKLFDAFARACGDVGTLETALAELTAQVRTVQADRLALQQRREREQPPTSFMDLWRESVKGIAVKQNSKIAAALAKIDAELAELAKRLNELRQKVIATQVALNPARRAMDRAWQALARTQAKSPLQVQREFMAAQHAEREAASKRPPKPPQHFETELDRALAQRPRQVPDAS